MRHVATRQCTRIIADYKKSCGFTLVDSNGKKYLDMFGSIASLPLGYNHPKLVKLARSVDPSVLIHKPAMGFFPPVEYSRLLNNVIKMSGLPHNRFYTMATGSEATENAIKLAYLRRQRITGMPADECSKMKVLSFETGFHGRTLGALSATHSNSGYKDGFPTFPWLKLPVGNSEQTITKLGQYLQTEALAACIIEPIQAEGGDVQLEPSVARDIRQKLYDARVPLIVDEVQTGVGATGKMWGHEWWELESFGLPPPDFVAVSKKAQTAGIFLFEEDVPEKCYQIFNTWLGNPWDLTKFEMILRAIHDDCLLVKVSNTGDYIQSQLQKIGDPVVNVRGQGTMIAFDVQPPLTNRQLMQILEDNGVIVGVCGKNSIRLRPPLTIGLEEADLFIQILRGSLPG